MTLKEFAKRLDAADAICRIGCNGSGRYAVEIEPRRTGRTQQIVSVVRQGTDVEEVAKAALGAFEPWRTSE